MRVFSIFLLVAIGTGPVLGLDVDSGLTPQHAVMADFDRDGLDDLAVANAFDDRVNIHLQNPQGDFPITQSIQVGINPSPPSNFPRFLVIEDINRDRYPDLIVLCSGQFSLGAKPSVQTLLNDRTGSFVRMPALPSTESFNAEEFPVQFAKGEFSGDNHFDLALCNLDGKNIRILEGSGTGLFEVGQLIAVDVSGEGPQDLAVFDGDRDGLDDLWVVTSNAFLVFHQTGPGVFASSIAFPLTGSPSQLRALTLEDLDGDGVIDAALADAGGSVHLIHGVDVLGASLDSTVVTDSSLSGCSDIVGVLWDFDSLPDLAVTNRTADSLSVLLSTGGVETFPTGMFPRRVETEGDFNGDGRFDLSVANEGDGGDPGNPDVTLIPNPSNPSSRLNLFFESEVSLGWYFYQAEVPSAQGLSLSNNPQRKWLIDSTQRNLMELDSIGSEVGVVEIPFEIGGIHMIDRDDGFILEKETGRIWEAEYEFREGGDDDDDDDDEPYFELESLLSFAFDPGEVGFSGLAFDEDEEEFFVGAPGVNRILRIDKDGNILDAIETEIPAWDLAWELDLERLLTVNPGRGDLRAYTREGKLDAGFSIDLSETYGLFDQVGISGVGWEEVEERITLLTTAGTVLEFESGVVSNPIPIAQTVDPVGIDYSDEEKDLFYLGGSGFLSIFSGEGLGFQSMFSVWPAIQAFPDFVPAGVAYDDDADEVLIADRATPVAARFDRSGNFLGFRDFTAEVGPIESPILGLDLSPMDSDPCLRTGTHLYYGPPPTVLPADFGSRSGVAWLDEGVFYPGRNPGEIVYLRSPQNPRSERVQTRDLRDFIAVGNGPQGTLFALTRGPSSYALQTYAIIVPSAVVRWSLYE